MGHNVYFVLCILSLICIGPFGRINPMIALAGAIIGGVFFLIWLIKEDKEQEKMFDKETK